MSNYAKSALLGMFILFVSCQEHTVSKPDLFEFGASQEEMMEKMIAQCESVKERTINPIELPTAQTAQTQLDCKGFPFEGQKRKVELVFADGQLDLVWILTEPEEKQNFIAAFTKQFGPPTHEIEGATFYLDAGVAVRNEPHEILFISDRLKEPYRQWLESNQ